MDVILGLFVAIILVLAVSKVRRGGTGLFQTFRPTQGSINIFQTPVPSSFGAPR